MLKTTVNNAYKGSRRITKLRIMVNCFMTWFTVTFAGDKLIASVFDYSHRPF